MTDRLLAANFGKLTKGSNMKFIEVGANRQVRKIACLQRSGGNPALFWLGGFKSDMRGTKASALDKIGQKLSLGVTRFDYSGHGQSDGEFENSTISLWLEEAIAVFEKTEGEQIVIGSSMGGWLAFLLNKYLHEHGQNRIRALITIAPAVDMTRDLMLARFTEDELGALEKNGRVEQPSDYGDPYVITRELIEDGQRHLLLDGPIKTGAPVHILQGGKDMDVPPAHALKLASCVLEDPLTLTLIPDGDHSLSRQQDIKALEVAITGYL
ncbi:2-hydroxymuconic semialdehyde hydrolase [hydrothermal vent metagenome]|uniref:2-hydroxymuconic semialdehyde hydrolase n=1 Tax=hydrothermal vent metagenome TaxID=652676 RepID=A0A3B0TSH5_9ZZZZ